MSWCLFAANYIWALNPCYSLQISAVYTLDISCRVISLRCYKNLRMTTVGDTRYQMLVICARALSTIWAITVRPAISSYELSNSTNNSVAQSSVQAVHPTVFQLPHFNNDSNNLRRRHHFFAFSWQRRPSATELPPQSQKGLLIR